MAHPAGCKTTRRKRRLIGKRTKTTPPCEALIPTNLLLFFSHCGKPALRGSDTSAGRHGRRELGALSGRKALFPTLCGLSFRGENAGFPLGFGRAALCSRLAYRLFNGSTLHRKKGRLAAARGSNVGRRFSAWLRRA